MSSKLSVHFSSPFRWFALVTVGVLLCLIGCAHEERVSFNDEVRPILNANCVGCHGGVKQAGGFGLVFRENALRETTTGHFAIVPGKPGKSELIRRLRHEDPELRMPLEGPPLPEADIQTLERWIAQGAEWEEHWAYQPVVPPTVPALDTAWVINDIDRFVLARLRQHDLAPAAPPAKATLLRRVSFDLTGLPPTPELADKFLTGTLSYEALVDSLLAQPAYGEHWAAAWLDLARYADSRGYERDRLRSIWRYRDWVIRAYNDDLPYNRFVTEQLAGDLLPNPTEDQLVATGFHRNTMSNEEGGSENEEFRVAAVMDRVNTTWEVFQGTSMSCVQCHAHPYDPLRHEDYFTSYALFNNTVDHDHISEAPQLRTLHQADAQKLRVLTDWVAAHEEGDGARVQRWEQLIRVREPRLRPYVYEDIVGGSFTGRADEDRLYLSPGNSFYLPATDLTDVAALHVDQRSMAPCRMEFRLGGPTGKLLGELEVTEQSKRRRDARVPLRPTPGNQRIFCHLTGPGQDRALAIDAIGFEPRLPGQDDAGLAEVERYIEELINAKDSVTTPIMVETEGVNRRKTHLFERGNWLVPGEEVVGGVPALLDGDRASKVPDRLAFANWLFTPEQPLTARVAVNRIWAGVFGRGLVATLEDFGSQGDRPSHPELLDYLAAEFSGSLAWSQKALLRRIVLSATYRQSSRATEQLRKLDPQNQLLARGPRKRLTAEQVRDQVLAVSGLLSPKMYGPGVMPHQPDGLWDQILHSRTKWVTSQGEDRYRRAVYTFLRRAVIHPGMTTFDGSSRDFCLSRRITTNTPLQALATLNDPAQLEAAEALARQVRPHGNLPDQIDALYQRLLLRSPAPEEVAVLQDLHAAATANYPPGEVELQALTVVANALLNLDESLTTS